MKNSYQHDDRTVVTLDAGGTNFVFGAMRGCEFITEPVRRPSNAHDLDLCLETLVEGFGEVIAQLATPPVAISFAFPGPADYPHGIIGGNLPNFPSFRDGVALGPFLEMKFGIPVFINNDGNLFAYGEAMAGTLPWVNARLAAAGSERRYRNLVGVTFGTGFGCGVVVGGELLVGDNASGGAVWCFRNGRYPDHIIEESVSIRAVKRVYAERSGDATERTPKEICDIARGDAPGDARAARESFAELGRAAGDTLAAVATLVDGIVVIGGGLTGAAEFILPALLEEMRRPLKMMNGTSFCRMQTEVLNLDDEASLDRFVSGGGRPLRVYGSDRVVRYDADKYTGLAISRLGASRAVSVGAYVYALRHLGAESECKD